jgi:DNA-binding transcriptional MerR regulator
MLIGEVSRRTGISARMLRHYDGIGLVSPSGRALSGYRQYSEEDVLRLFQVEGLRSLGLSLNDVAAALADVSFNVADLVEKLITRGQDRLTRETELLNRLKQVRASDPADWSDVMRTIELMRRLSDGDPSTRQHFVLSRTDQRAGDAELLVDAVLSEPVANVAGALQWALARVGDSSVPALQEALSSTSPQRRHRAVEALVKIGSTRATTALINAFPHSDPVVNGRSALARGARGEADVIPALMNLVVQGRDDVEAADVLAVLAGRHNRADEIAQAIGRALIDAPDRVRQRLAQALGDIPGPAAADILDGLRNDADPGVAATASFLVGQRTVSSEQPDGSGRASRPV